MNRTFDLIWLRIREYFKHPAEDIRQAVPIVPGRLYTNFGYICKAVPYNKKESGIIEKIREEKENGQTDMLYDTISKEILGFKVSSISPADPIQEEVARLNELDCGCIFCDFHRKAIPCPLYNQLSDGSTVCDTHKYVILKNQR
jgi:hypothetical protein